MNSFQPIKKFTIPYLILKVEDWDKKYNLLYDHISKLNLLIGNESGDSYVPTDFWNGNNHENCNFISTLLKDEIDKISRKFFEYANEFQCSNDMGYGFAESYNEDQHKFLINTSWFELSNTYHWHPPHDHGTTELACVLYINFDQRVHKPLEMISPFLSFSSTRVSFTPENIESGDIICFPGNIMHYTYPNDSVVPRLVAAWNMNRKLTYDQNIQIKEITKNQ